jgi:hypothetical protein
MDFHRQARPSVGLTCIYQSSLTLAPILYAFAPKINAAYAISCSLTRTRYQLGIVFYAGKTGVASHLVSNIRPIHRSHSPRAGSFRPQSITIH